MPLLMHMIQMNVESEGQTRTFYKPEWFELWYVYLHTGFLPVEESQGIARNQV